MRTSFIAPFLLLPLLAAAQQKVVPTPPPPPQGSNWQHVQVLPLGTTIQVKTRTSSAKCALKSVDADSLTCLHGKDLVFQRSDILTIKIERRRRSTAVGAAIGAGAGIALGAAANASTPGNDRLPPGPVATVAMSGVIFGILGMPIGYFTDFTKSTIYKAP